MKLLFVFLVACSPRPYRVSATHPASPAAPIGRLAGPPAALRPGVVEAPAAPAP
jgi:hypothetical protein